jgi:hypothetical protein
MNAFIDCGTGGGALCLGRLKKRTIAYIGSCMEGDAVTKNDDTLGRYPVPREEIRRPLARVTTLDYEAPHRGHAHASAHRAFVDWSAVAKEHARQEFHGPAAVESVGEIVVVPDDGSLTLTTGEINYIAAWNRVRQTHGDEFDFVTFFADFSVPFGYSFWSPIHAATEGIRPYAPFDVRGAWGTNRLQGFHFINPGHIDLMGVYLQEFGHQWGSYVYFAPTPDSPFVYADLLLDGEPGHWDFFVDDAHSPMNYDFLFAPAMSTHWEQRPGDPTLFDYHATEGIEYCDLDLYLMGLLAPAETAPLYIITNPQQVGPQTWRGQPFEVTVDMVINAMGPRQAPPDVPTNAFRNAWVLVSQNPAGATKLAARLDDTRQDFELRFHVATRCLARVDTTLP